MAQETRTLVRLLRLTTAALGLGLLGGCAAPSAGGPASLTDAERVTPFALIDQANVWSRQPTALVAIGRALGNSGEQVVALENSTTLAGDNVLRVRAYYRGGPRPPVFALDEFVRMHGGYPAPFDASASGALRVIEDAAGDFVWTEQTVSGAVCVLALRRLDAAEHLVPPDVAAMDVMLRNCVPGDRAEALAPMRPDRIAAAGGFARPGLDERGRMLSPLAGPQPGAARSMLSPAGARS